MMKWWADASYIPIRILWKATHLGRIKDICFTVIAQEVDLLSDLMCTFSFFFKETISFLKPCIIHPLSHCKFSLWSKSLSQTTINLTQRILTCLPSWWQKTSSFELIKTKTEALALFRQVIVQMKKKKIFFQISTRELLKLHNWGMLKWIIFWVAVSKFILCVII